MKSLTSYSVFVLTAFLASRHEHAVATAAHTRARTASGSGTLEPIETSPALRGEPSRDASFLAVGRHPDISREGTHSYLCRFSHNGGECGDRAFHKDGRTYRGASCPGNLCCSKTACQNWQCGNFCSSSWALCSTAVVYHPENSYGGNCSCAKLGRSCSANATCIDENWEGGGAICRCKEGYRGDGIECVPDSCSAEETSACSPGSCRKENGAHRCSCPEGYVEKHRDDGRSYCASSAVCQSEGHRCSSHGTCVDEPGSTYGYKCLCGIESWLSDEESPRCIDVCQDQGGIENCGPGVCISTSFQSYRCRCPEGYWSVDNESGRQMCKLPTPEGSTDGAPPEGGQVLPPTEEAGPGEMGPEPPTEEVPPEEEYHPSPPTEEESSEEEPEYHPPPEEGSSEEEPEYHPPTEEIHPEEETQPSPPTEELPPEEESYPSPPTEELPPEEESYPSPPTEELPPEEEPQPSPPVEEVPQPSPPVVQEETQDREIVNAVCDPEQCKPGECLPNKYGQMDCMCPRNYIQVVDAGFLICMFAPR
ncbi:microneme protein mic3 [Cystoisospora suis]|uniref:Microneme protein mic3 n=1 Tax=Cystoisospora suis TaxID=483139 RepID=A0A2C6KG99_9APIC|nr:microneme protein mic3 [Cystoisospora suis]